MRGFALVLMSACLVASAARAEDVQPTALAGPAPQGTAAFEHAYGASFYEFDACGDGLAGRIYRRALTERVARCPFSAEAKEQFQRRSTLQRVKASRAIQQMIEERGGLPVQLEGMTRTCHEQIASPEYRAVRDRLLEYAAGHASGDSVVREPCDAQAVSP